MDPKIWGPEFWFVIHTTSLGYPESPKLEDKKHYKEFYESLKNILPCEECRNNYSNHLREDPLTSKVLKSRKNLFLWTVKIHNKVNKANGKKIYDPSYVLKKYRKIYKTNIAL